MQVSVIIPVYNSEAYLQQCLDSVLSQSCNDLEILLIDDSSEDKSREICENYAARYPQVHTIHIEHSGAGFARNEGLRMAQGDYIVFADADDYFPTKDSIQKMIDLLEATNADVAVGNYCRLWDGQILEATKHSVFSKMDRSSGNFRYCGFFSVGTLSYVWGKVYRRSFIMEHVLSFRNYEYAEDRFFNLQCYIGQAQYVFVDDVVYTYRKNNTSVSHLNQLDRSLCWLQIATDLQNYLKKMNLLEQYGDLIAYTVNFTTFFDSKSLYCRSGKKLSAVKAILQKYATAPIAYSYFDQLSRGKFISAAYGIGWKISMWCFAVMMRIKALRLLSFAIKLLVDLRIDEQLSDTGRKKSK